PTCPIGGVVWHEAASYCNWLSEREGIPKTQWCYETDTRGQVTRLKENYLILTGYRLATEAEWEYACRAGAATARYYGESEDLLAKYAWYFKDSGGDLSQAVGGKKPNDLGLFDMHGNVYSWCQETYQDYPRAKNGAIEDKEDDLDILSTKIRVLRGGSFNSHAVAVRSALRNRLVPTDRDNLVGFRPARTFR